MNWRRGLFRLWIVGSALFAITVASISYSGIKAEFNAVALQRTVDASQDELLVPQLCGNARGVAGTDYAIKQRQAGPWDIYAKPNFFDDCWYAMSKFRPLYPEFKNVSDKELARKLYTDHGIPIRELPTLGQMWEGWRASHSVFLLRC